MTHHTLSEAELLELIEAYGADLSAWPEDVAMRAESRLANPGAVLRAALDEAAQLDAMLAGLPEIEPPAHLAAVILEQAPARKAERGGGVARIFSWLRAPGLPMRTGAALASLAVGLSVGFGSAAASAPAEDDFDTVMSETLGLDYASTATDFWTLPE